MEKPLVTIGVTSYNHAEYIIHALDSVLIEDYPNKEIVIVDDGSTDNSVKLIQDWINVHGHELPVRLISRPNKGLAYSLRELLAAASGKYVAFLASDDAFCNNGISKRMKVLQETNKMLVVGDCSMIDGEGKIVHISWMKDIKKRDPELYKTEEGIMKEVLLHPSISGSVLMFDKNIFDLIGKYPKNFYAEEFFFYQRCAAYRQMVYLDEIVSLYRRHDTNTSGPNVSGARHLVRSIVKSYWISWWLFPGIKMKVLALEQWARWKYSYLRTYVLK